MGRRFRVTETGSFDIARGASDEKNSHGRPGRADDARRVLRPGRRSAANTDPSANLSSYRTYTFAAETGTDRQGYSTPITSYFKESIRREMDARGFKFVEGGTADLLVNFNANARENVDVRTTPGTPTYGMATTAIAAGCTAGVRRLLRA